MDISTRLGKLYRALQDRNRRTQPVEQASALQNGDGTISGPPSFTAAKPGRSWRAQHPSFFDLIWRCFKDRSGQPPPYQRRTRLQIVKMPVRAERLSFSPKSRRSHRPRNMSGCQQATSSLTILVYSARNHTIFRLAFCKVWGYHEYMY